MPPPSSRRFRPDIEGLRCIAVLAVLAFHLEPRWLPGGFQGVDMFFVISGYLITRLILDQRGGFSFTRFYVRRFWRLFPALSTTIGATVAAAYFVMSPADYRDLGASALAALAGVSNFYFYGQLDYFNDNTLVHPLLHTWSLGVEEQFYLFWPLLVVFAVGRLAPLALFGWLAIAAFALNTVLAGADPQFAFYMMPFRVFEFAAGAALLMVEKRLPPRPRLAAGFLGAALLATGFVLFDDNRAWPGAAALLPVGGTVLAIYGGGGRLGLVLGNPVFLLIGRVSYALYLVHWPVIVLYRYWRVVPLNLAETGMLALASIAAALVLHVVVETPFREGKAAASGLSGLFDIRRFVFWRRLRAPLLAAGALVTLGLAAAVWVSGGLPGRVAKLRAQQAPGELSYAGDICAGSRTYRCVLGDPTSERLVYVIGDSHAGNLFFGLDRLFREQGIRGIGVMDHGCLFLAGTTRFIKGQKDSRCARNIDDAFQAAAGDRAPVILAGNYDGYNGEMGPAAASAPLALDEAAYYGFLRNSLIASLDRLNAGARPVLLVKSTYNSGIDTARCLSRPGINPDQLLAGECAPWNLARNREKSGRADDMLEEVAGQFAGVATLDPKAAFCRDGVASCDLAGGGAFFLRDTTHLTNDGSLFLVSHFNARLLAWLGSPAPAHGADLGGASAAGNGRPRP